MIEAPATNRVRRCTECGCTDTAACVTEDGPCHWVGAALCSSCSERLLNAGGLSPVLQAGDEEALKRPIKMEMEAAFCFSLLCTIQLACRHPRFNGPTRLAVESFARELQQRVGTTTHLALMIEAGWQRRFDIKGGE